MFVRLSIPRPYNGGEWRVSKEVTGPRGGKHWERIISEPATGGEYRTRLEAGNYKRTTWSNGWPSSHLFTVDRKEVTKDGQKCEEWTLTDEDGQITEEYQIDDEGE